MRQIVRLGALIPALLLVASGCASKDWVREVLGKKEAEIDQRFAKVEGRVGEESERIGREADRVGRVEVRVGEEAQRVEGMGFRVKGLETSVVAAGEGAKAALARAEEVDGRLTRLWSSRHDRSLVETVQVQFGFDRSELDDGAQTALLSMVKELLQNPRLGLELEGYTDAVGAREYNIQLSQRRVEAVRRFLVGSGIALPRIHAVGLGPITERGVPDEKKRRVTVKLTATE